MKVLVDNPIAVQNLEKLGGYMGLETKAEKLEEHEYSVWFYGKNPDISKEGIIAENPAEEPEKIEVFPEETCIPDSRKKGKVVVISSAALGAAVLEVFAGAFVALFTVVIFFPPHNPYLIFIPAYAQDVKLTLKRL